MKICVFTLGCKVNASESESLARALREAGHTVTEKLENADLFIVNTCAVTAEAEKKSRQTAARIRALNPAAEIVYTGCACQKDPAAFLKKSNARLVTGVFDKGKIVLDVSGEEKAQKQVDDLLSLFNEISVECGN